MERGNSFWESIAIANKARLGKIEVTLEAELARLMQCESEVLRDFAAYAANSGSGAGVGLVYKNGKIITVPEADTSSNGGIVDSSERTIAVKKLCDTALLEFVDADGIIW